MKVYISPSTQENNKTALGNTEEDLMHAIADVLVPILHSNGLTVYKGRREQTLQQMVAESNNLKVNAHVALHSNAHDKKTRGAEIYHYPSSTNGINLSQAVYNEIMKISPVAGRGLKPTSSLYELTYTNAPATLLEVDFHDNLEGAKWIRDNTKEIAEAVAKGICYYFNIPYRVPSDNGGQYKEALRQIKSIVDGVLGE